MSNAANTPEEKSGAPNTSGIEAILSNPAILRTIGTLINGAKANDTDTSQNPVNTVADTENNTVPASADGLSALLSNPAMMEKLPQMIAWLKPMMESAIPQVPKDQSAESLKPELCRDQLLLSLKPFLSPSRREAVDTLIRIAKLGTVFQQLK